MSRVDVALFYRNLPDEDDQIWMQINPNHNLAGWLLAYPEAFIKLREILDAN